MKRILALGLMVVATGAFAAANDILVSFSTPGPDTYRDGSTVLDGERYALVWTAEGETFGGLNADGTCVKPTDAIVLVAPLAKGGKCPSVVFEIDADDYAAKYTKGTFAVYLLDTRVTATTLAATDAEELPTLVNGFAAATEAVKQTDQGGALVAAHPVAATVESAVEVPVVSAIRVAGGVVSLTVKGLSAAVDYRVVAGEAPTGVTTEVPAERQGETFTTPAVGGKFFKVIGSRKF